MLARALSNKHMDVRDLRIFSRVAALQNLTAVASVLGTTAGTVSKRIQALEEGLGVRLLDRTTRSVRLTEEGRIFLARVDRIVTELDIAQDELSAASGQPSGRLAISAPASLARCLVYPAIISFTDAYPGVDVHVDITDRISNLHEEGYDAAIRTGALPDSTLKAKRLASDAVILAASPSYLEKRGTPRTPADLGGHDCLVGADCRTWHLFRDGLTEQVPVAGRLASDNGAFLHMAALDCAGIVRGSLAALKQDIASGRLVRVLPDYVLAPNAAIWAVYPNAKQEMPRLRAFLDHLGEYCREHFGEGAGETKPLPHGQPATITRPANHDDVTPMRRTG